MIKDIVKLNVEGMSCSHCENAVKKAVGALDGVLGVEVDLASKSVTVEYDQDILQIDIIKAAIDDQGYEVK